MIIRNKLNPALIISWIIFIVATGVTYIRYTSFPKYNKIAISILLTIAIFFSMLRILSSKFHDAYINGNQLKWRDLPIHILGIVGLFWYSIELWRIMLDGMTFNHFIIWELLKFAFLLLFIILERGILFENFTFNPLDHKDIQTMGDEMKEQLDNTEDDYTKALFEWLDIKEEERENNEK